jgi:hypothetical protein
MSVVEYKPEVQPLFLVFGEIYDNDGNDTACSVFVI